MKPTRTNLANRTSIKPLSSLNPFMQWVYGVSMRVFTVSLWVWVLTLILSSVVSVITTVTGTEVLVEASTFLHTLLTVTGYGSEVAALVVIICFLTLLDVKGR